MSGLNGNRNYLWGKKRLIIHRIKGNGIGEVQSEWDSIKFPLNWFPTDFDVRNLYRQTVQVEQKQTKWRNYLNSVCGWDYIYITGRFLYIWIGIRFSDSHCTVLNNGRRRFAQAKKNFIHIRVVKLTVRLRFTLFQCDIKRGNTLQRSFIWLNVAISFALFTVRAVLQQSNHKKFVFGVYMFVWTHAWPS